jgi:hypothetical protein
MELAQYEKRTAGFHSKFNLKHMGDDFYTLDFALKNRDMKRVEELTKKHGVFDEYQEVKNVLKELRDKAVDVGIDIGFIEDYFPRVVDDVQGFLNHLRNTDNWTMIEQAIAKEEKRIGFTLNDADRARIIVNMTSGYGSDQIRLGGTKFSKERTIDKLTAEYNQFYKEGNEALAMYLRSMNAMIEGRKFLGRESKELVGIRQDLRNATKRMNEIDEAEPVDIKKKKLGQLFSILDNLKRQIRTTDGVKDIADIEEKVKDLEEYIDFVIKIQPESVKKMVIDKLNKKIESLQEIIESEDTNLDAGIASYVNQLVKDESISQDKIQEVTDILRARLSPKQITNESLKLVRDVTYLATLNDITNGITQLGDIFLSVYKHNLSNTLVGLGKVLTGTGVTRNDIGIGDSISAEYSELKTRDKARNFIFKYSGIQPIDGLGKGIIINAKLEQMKNLAKADNAALKSEVMRVFGEGWETVWKDIKKGKPTYDVKYLLFAAVSDLQPISLSETPQGYLQAGNFKVMYMLKTFALKSMDIARNDVYNQIRKGNTVDGVANLFKLCVTFALMGATTDALKDFILGRDFDLEDSALDGLLQLVMFNRYIGYTGKRDGYIKAWVNSQMPPLWKVADDMIRDFTSDEDIPDWKSIRNLPLIGDPFYWWFGGGIKAKRKMRKRSRR